MLRRKGKASRSMFLHNDIYSPFSEAYRRLKVNIELKNEEQESKCIAIVSARSGEGRSTAALHLAQCYANDGKRALLVDGDLRNPSLQTLLVSEPLHSTGMSEFLSHPTVLLFDIIRETTIPDVSVIISGALPANPSDLLMSKRMDELLSEVKKRYDVIIVDTPPMSEYVDAKVVAAKCDGTLFLVGSREVKQEAAERALEELKLVRANILGAVLNKVPGRRRGLS